MNRCTMSAVRAMWLVGVVLSSLGAAERHSPDPSHSRWLSGRPGRQGSVGPGFRPGSDPAAFMIDTSVTYGPAPGDQCHPATASTGSGWLVVWSDARDFTLRAGRFSADGALLDTGGTTIAGINYLPCQADVAFDGVNYLVVWETDNYPYAGDVKAAHVSPDGAVLNTFVVCAEPFGQFGPWVAAAGETSLVVWLDGRSGRETEVYAARVLRSGSILDRHGFRVGSLGWSPMTPTAVEYGGGRFLVAWSSNDSLGRYVLLAARIGMNGVVIDTTPIVLRASPDYESAEPTIAFGDTCFLVAWQEGDYAQMDIIGRRVSVGGRVLDPGGIQVAPFPDQQEQAAATFDGANYLVTWLDIDADYNRTMRARRLTRAGALLDSNQIRIVPSQAAAGAPAACYNGTDFVVAWDGGWAATGADIYCARVTGAGVVRDPNGMVLPLGVEAQKLPVVAFDGANYLAVWLEQHESLLDVCGARVTPAGTVLDPGGFTISRATALGYDAIAYGSGVYLVAWNYGDPYMTDSVVIFAARVAADGSVLDTTPLRPRTGLNIDVAPDLAFDGANFLVVWCSYTDPGYAVFGARVTPAGAVLDPHGFAICREEESDILPAVAFDGANYVVAWARGYDSADIYCALVGPDGSVSSPQLVSNARGNQRYPAVASGPAGTLVVWMDSRINGQFFDIYAARVSHSGEVLDPAGIPVTNSSYDEGLPEVVFDGSGYELFWARRSLDSFCYVGAKLDTAGRTVAAFAPFGQADASSPIRAACGAPGDVFAVYQSWTGIAGGRQYDNYRVWGKMGPFIGVTETKDEDRRTMNASPTIVRGVLNLGAYSRQHTAYRAELLDIGGRKVLDLRPGANDVRSLAPGIYFVRERSAVSRQPSAVSVRKVILTK